MNCKTYSWSTDVVVLLFTSLIVLPLTSAKLHERVYTKIYGSVYRSVIRWIDIQKCDQCLSSWKREEEIATLISLWYDCNRNLNLNLN